jgi:hypothetical protein
MPLADRDTTATRLTELGLTHGDLPDAMKERFISFLHLSYQPNALEADTLSAAIIEFFDSLPQPDPDTPVAGKRTTFSLSEHKMDAFLYPMARTSRSYLHDPFNGGFILSKVMTGTCRQFGLRLAKKAFSELCDQRMPGVYGHWHDRHSCHSKQVAVAQAETPMTSLMARHNARVLKLKWARNERVKY